jgi:hypothetical protein
VSGVNNYFVCSGAPESTVARFCLACINILGTLTSF